MAKVSLLACSQYELGSLRAALADSIRNLGGWEPYIRPGEKVLLKVNLVTNKDPDYAATTHPLFVQALAELLMEYGARRCV